MLIVLDCPNCKKRYEIESALAGKKSRCKQCGEIFKIPVPRAIPTSPKSQGTSSQPAKAPSGASEWRSGVTEPRATSKVNYDSSPRTTSSPSAAGSSASKILLNCPNCGKRYEVDGVLAGKKSRCKDCGAVFSIPVPRGRASESATVPHPQEALNAPLTPAYWESVLDDEPSTFKASRGPAPALEDDLPPPPRAAYPQPRRDSRSRRSSGNNPDVGVTIAGFYVLLVIAVFAGFWIWKTAAEPTNERVGAIFSLTVFFVHGTAVVLGLSGSIWVLVLAFQEKLEQGLLCLLVPCYEIYYVFSRWDETRGAFTLQILPAANMIVAAAVAFSFGYVRGYERGLQSTDGGAEQVAPELDDRPPMAVDLAPGPDAPPGFGMPPGRRPSRFGNPRFGNRGDASFRFQRFNTEQDAQSVTLIISGMPANSDAAQGVTARDVSEAIRKRLQELVPAATNFLWMNRNNKSTLVIAPVDDIASLVNRIDFGTAKLKDRQIDLYLSPDFVASVPRLPAEPVGKAGGSGRAAATAEPEIPADADAVTRSLIQLKSLDSNKRKQALNRLERSAPDERLAEVVAAIVPLLDDDDGWLVGDAIKVLTIWKSPEAVPPLIGRLGDNRGFVRHEAIKALGKIKDPRGVEPLVLRIQEDGGQVEDALKAMGPMAEQALIERLTNPDSGVRRRVCNILKDIGGKETLKAMQSLPADPDFGVRIAAKETMGAIVLRVGPLSPSERKGKATSGSNKGRGPN